MARPSTRALTLSFVIALTATTGAPAWSGDGDALIQKGLELRRRGSDAEALKCFREAYELTRAPRAMAQIGLAEQALGAWPAAEKHLREALSIGADAWIRKNRGVLENALAVVDDHLGTLEVSGSPERAEVSIDGEAVGALPVKVRVTAGTVVVEVRAPDFLPVRRPTAVTAGSLTRERFNLQRERSGAQAAAATSKDRSGEGGNASGAAALPVAVEDRPAREPTPPPAMVSRSTPEAGGAESAPGAWRTPVIWTTGIAAVLSLGWGVTETLIAGSRVSTFNERSDCNRDAADRGGARCSELYDEGQRAKLLSYVGFGLAGALAATSVVLLVTRPSSPAGSSVACAPHGNDVGVSCRFVF